MSRILIIKEKKLRKLINNETDLDNQREKPLVFSQEEKLSDLQRTNQRSRLKFNFTFEGIWSYWQLSFEYGPNGIMLDSWLKGKLSVQS